MPNEFCDITEAGDGTVRLTLANAGKANILSTPVMDGLIAGLAQLALRDDIRLLVLTAGGERAFIAGADLAEMAELDPASARAFIGRLRDLCEAVRSFPVPVVARIAGWCLGGGLELAMACDLRIAARHAKFAMPEVKVGIPSVIHAALLPRLIGAGRARWMILSGETIDAETALHWGLVDHVAEMAQLDDAVATMIAPILACAPEAIRAQKVLFRQWEELPFSEAVAASIEVFGQAFASDEPRRRMRAFLDRKGK
jgi:enoyl-CoA hydratase/carnithine racemase